MKSGKVIAALLLAGFCLPRAAQGVLTSRVPGLEPALNDALRVPSCGLQVEDLVFREGSFALSTTGSVLLRFAREDRGQTACTTHGWRVGAWEKPDPLAAACAQEVCRALEAQPALANALLQALGEAPTAVEEAPIPLTWSAPFPKGLSLVWFLSCVASLVLLLVLPIVAHRTRKAGRVLSRVDWALIIAIACAGTAIRVNLARNAMVELDETVSVGYDSLWREFDGRETVMNPPLYRVISYPLTMQTKGAAVSGRAVPVALGFLLVLILGRLGAEIGGRRMAWAAAALGAVHPWLVMATVYHRGYAPLVAMTAFTLLATLLALRSDRMLDRYVVAAGMAGTFLSHYSGAAVVAGVALWILVADLRRWRSWIGPAGLAVLLCAPYVPAALSGAHAKENSPIGTAGAPHAAKLALSMLSVIGGLVRPRLETPIYLEQSQRFLLTAAGLVTAILLLGVWKLRHQGGWGLLGVMLASAALPVFMAVRLTTVREFQGVEAAVPGVLLATALVGAGRSRIVAFFGAMIVIALALGGIHVIPFGEAGRTKLDALSAAVRADSKAWPVFVWGPGSPSYSDVALDLGLSRPAVDASTDGRDPKIRALRSCSTAAVREAARLIARDTVTILSVDPGCGRDEFAGRAVQCEPSRPDPAGFFTTSCRVDLGVPGPTVELPSRIPAHLRRRVDRAIPPGHEQFFMTAAAPFVLGQANGQGTSLAGISIGMEYVKYQLKTATGLVVSVLASPHFDDEEVTGTDFVVEPAMESLEGEARAATIQLKEALLAHLSPPVWNDVYGLVTNGAGGHTPVKPRPWLLLSALGGVVLAVTLARARRPTIVSE